MKKALALVLALVMVFALVSTEAFAAKTDSSDVPLTMWNITSEPTVTILNATIEKWNAQHPDEKIEFTAFPSDEFKVKIRTAIGAKQPPNFIFSWGGGVCKSYADAGALVDLTPILAEHEELSDLQIPAIMSNVTFDGKIYGIPINNVQPAVFFYNKEVFANLGIEIPETWDELLATFPVFQEAGIAPIAVAGQSMWTYLFYLGYLVDRAGGSEVFDRIAANEKDCWSDPAVTTALEKLIDLVEAGGFQIGYESISADANADCALVANGKAGMILQHGGKYGAFKNINADWAASGNLGYFEFPALADGKGDSNNLYGNTANYWSISAYASQEDIDASIDFLLNGTWTDPTYAQAYVDAGAVPAIKGVDDAIANATGVTSEWMTFVSNITQKAPHFQMSWDNALSPNQASALLTNLSQIMLLQMTPEEFVKAMNLTVE